MLNYLNRTLSKSERRKVAKYMSQYNNLEAIIKSRRMEIEPTITASIKPDNVQESNNSLSEADKYLEETWELDEIEMIKRRLNYAYNKVKPLHKLIWTEHFINDVRDFELYYDEDHGLTKRTYYREKEELMNVVAECLGDML